MARRFYYCGRCGKYLTPEETFSDKNGLKCCSYCGSRLRLRPRHRNEHKYVTITPEDLGL